MLIKQYPNSAFGGKAFITQPNVVLIDAGGNQLVNDKTSLVFVEIATNPSLGELSPRSRARVTVIQGVAQFMNLRIDKSGNNYALKFTLHLPVDNTLTTYEQTKLFVLGNSFNVYVGILFSLKVVIPPANAIAGAYISV